MVNNIIAVKKLRQTIDFCVKRWYTIMGDKIMIEKFIVSNYKGFNGELVFDLSKTRDYAFNEHLIKNGLVNKGIIYGKNGSGKSNLGFALYDLTVHLTDKQKPNEMIGINYLNLDSNLKEATFTYYFKFEEERIIYSYIKTNINKLIYESLKVNNKEIISYNFLNKNEQFVNVKGTEHLRFDLNNNNLSILKYIYKNTPNDEDSPITKVVKFAENMLWFRCLSDGTGFNGYKEGNDTMDNIIISNNKIEEFESFLLKNELHYHLFAKNVNNENKLFVKFENGEALFSSIISSGTKALWLYYCWSIYFDNVSFLYLDEFDAYYHFETAKLILQAICEKKEMQAIVTSHNTYLMQNSLMRPDCCFILSNNKVTALCDATDKEIREAHNLEKLYRNGAFQE